MTNARARSTFDWLMSLVQLTNTLLICGKSRQLYNIYTLLRMLKFALVIYFLQISTKNAYKQIRMPCKKVSQFEELIHTGINLL